MLWARGKLDCDCIAIRVHSVKQRYDVCLSACPLTDSNFRAKLQHFKCSYATIKTNIRKVKEYCQM